VVNTEEREMRGKREYMEKGRSRAETRLEVIRKLVGEVMDHRKRILLQDEKQEMEINDLEARLLIQSLKLGRPLLMLLFHR
jgi:hypothetical protein